MADYLDRLETAARGELPGDVAVERQEGAVALSGPGLRMKRVTDARLRGLAAGAARR